MKTNKWSKKLRKNATPVEQRLWYYLRAKRLGGYKFRRQQSIGPFVVDFYCAEKRVAVEIDGPSHGEQLQMKKDPKRQRFQEQLGFVVLRYRNDQIVHDIGTVLEAILNKLNSI